jgi:ribosome-associated toxin RatA of RatAB toxin-antitoxin module
MRGLVISVSLAAILLLSFSSGLFAAGDFVPVPNIDKYLTPATMEKLKAGEVVKENVITKDAKGNDSGRGVAFVLVNAPKDKIMAVIMDYASYPSWMPNTDSVKVIPGQGDRVDVEFELTILGFGVNYTVIHKVDKEAGTVQWRMDDSKPKKNVQDSVGAWVIKPIEGDQCVVAYTVVVDTGLSVPKFIQDWLSNKSLVKVEKAVKKRVEAK